MYTLKYNVISVEDKLSEFKLEINYDMIKIFYINGTVHVKMSLCYNIAEGHIHVNCPK